MSIYEGPTFKITALLLLILGLDRGFITPVLLKYVCIIAVLYIILINNVLDFITDRMKHFKNKSNRMKLLNFAQNDKFRLIKMENRNELTNKDIESLLAKTDYITVTRFPNSNIMYPFIAGYSFNLKNERFPFNVVVIEDKIN